MYKNNMVEDFPKTSTGLFKINICLLETFWSSFALDPDHGLVVRLLLRLILLQLLQRHHFRHHPPPPAPHEEVGQEGENQADNTTDNDRDLVAGVEEADTAPYKKDKVKSEGNEEGGQRLVGVDAVGQADGHVDGSNKKTENGNKTDGGLGKVSGHWVST